MRIKQFQYSNEKQPANNTHVKFTPDENVTCSPDPCSPVEPGFEWVLEPSDLDELTWLYGGHQIKQAAYKTHHLEQCPHEINVLMVLAKICAVGATACSMDIAFKQSKEAVILTRLLQAMENNVGVVKAAYDFICDFCSRLSFEVDTCLVLMLFMRIYRTESR